MKIPEFTAEASLYETRTRYRSLRPEGGPQGTVLPQLGGKGFKGMAGCMMDCEDRHPNWTTAQCARTCKDPFAGVDLSTPGNWFNDFLSSAGIDLWETACGSLVHPVPCAWVADEMRRQS